MANEIEPLGHEPIRDESPATHADEALQEERSAERALVVGILKSVAICVPIAIPVCIGLIALALRNDHPSWGAWLGMATGIGVLVGVFFGVWAGFVTKAHLLDEVEEHATHPHD
jgi:hypothetical protein